VIVTATAAPGRGTGASAVAVGGQFAIALLTNARPCPGVRSGLVSSGSFAPFLRGVPAGDLELGAVVSRAGVSQSRYIAYGLSAESPVI
jgi:hypothetical protein